MMNKKAIKVNCYAGYKYPEAPRYFYIDDKKFEVEKVLGSYKEEGPKPGKFSAIRYTVKTKEGRVFEISYHINKDQWFLERTLQIKSPLNIWLREESQMKEEELGRVIKYFAKPGAAGVEITKGSLSIGDKIHIKGHTTDFQQEITSMQIEDVPIAKAQAGQIIGIKVEERVRPKDVIYKVINE